MQLRWQAVASHAFSSPLMYGSTEQRNLTRTSKNPFDKSKKLQNEKKGMQLEYP